jgi:hypothetical protein
MWKNLASALNEGFKEIGAAAIEEVGAVVENVRMCFVALALPKLGQLK